MARAYYAGALSGQAAQGLVIANQRVVAIAIDEHVRSSLPEAGPCALCWVHAGVAQVPGAAVGIGDHAGES